MNANNNISTGSFEGPGEVDIRALLLKVWESRRQIMIISFVAFCAALVIAFSLPREYATRVVLASEQSGTKNVGVAALASAAGIDMSGYSSYDALSPSIYPEIVLSTPFLIELLNTEVTASKSDYTGTFYTYLDTEIKTAWWKSLLILPAKMISAIFSNKNNIEDIGMITDPIKPTQKQSNILKHISERISVKIDQKNGIAEMSVNAQDPLVSAMMADTLLRNLQTYITKYRTNKASNYLAFVEEQHEEAKANFLVAQREFSDYADGNKNPVVYRRITEQGRLENELKIAFELYSQTAQQLALAKAKVAEQTPVFTVIEPVVIPVGPSGPGKIVIIFGITLLVFTFAVIWVLYLKDFITSLRTETKSAE